MYDMLYDKIWPKYNYLDYYIWNEGANQDTEKIAF